MEKEIQRREMGELILNAMVKFSSKLSDAVVGAPWDVLSNLY